MKNQSTPFERQGFEDESDLQDIFKLLTELDKSKHAKEALHQHSNKSQPKRKHYEPPASQESQANPLSISHNFSPQIKRKISTVLKPLQQKNKEQNLKNEPQHSLNQLSNMSASSKIQAKCLVPIENIKSSEKSSFIIKNSNQKIAEKNKLVAELQKQLQQYQSRYDEKQSAYLQEKKKQKQVLGNVLKEANLQMFKYNQYLEHINIQRKNIINEDVIEKNNELIRVLKEEESKYKPRKKVKNIQTMTLSDEQDQKISQYMEKQKKYYFSVIGAKIQKEKQKYEGLTTSLKEKKISMLSQQRIKSLKKLQEMKQIELLSMTESSNVQQILAVDIEKCHQVRIHCIKFNPNIQNDQRSKIFANILEEINSGKKLMTSSNHHLFAQKSNIFIPLSQIILREDQILLINQCSHSYFSLQNFLNRIEIGPIQQHFHIIRYIIRVCLKGLQEISNQLNHDKFLILPFNIYFNQKWQLKLSNIALNQLLFQHFKHIFHEDDHYYFPPEQKTDKHSYSLWSLGILTYFLCFGSKPFQKYQPYHWNSREEFFMFNQLQIVQKSASYDKCKDFIMYCLTKKGAINFNQVCSEPFLSQVK